MVSGVIAHHALGENLLMPARPAPLREVVGEVAANNRRAPPRHQFGGPIHVGDLARRADRDQWVQAGFDQAAGIAGGGRQLGVRSATRRSSSALIWRSSSLTCSAVAAASASSMG